MKIFGNENQDVELSLNNLGTLCKDEGDLKEARRYLEESLKVLLLINIL